MKQLIVWLLCIVLLPLCSVDKQPVEDGFSTPEEAVVAFLEGLRDQDFSKAMSAIRTEESGAGGRFRDIILGYSFYTPERWPALPGNTKLEEDINTALLSIQNADDLCLFFAALTYPNSSSWRNNGMSSSSLRTGTVKTEEEAAALLSSFDLSRVDDLAGMSDIRVIKPDEATNGTYSSYKRLATTLDRLRIRFGADGICERAAYFTIDGKEYVFAPVLGRYGSSWYIISFYGHLAGKLDIIGATGSFRLVGDGVERASAADSTAKDATPLLAWEEVGGATPEEAAALYLEGLRDGDLGKIMSAFAWDTMREHTSLTTVALTNGYYSGTNNWPVFPEGNALLKQLDLAELAKQRLSRLTLSLADFLTEGAIFEDQQWVKQRRLFVRSEEEADAVLALFDETRTEQLDGLSNIRFFQPSDYVPGFTTEKIQKAEERYRVLYGADELADVIAVFTIGGEEYVIMPQLLRYGDRWYINTMNSVTAIICNMPLTNCALCKLSALQ
jgi:hypothetical protein